MIRVPVVARKGEKLSVSVEIVDRPGDLAAGAFPTLRLFTPSGSTAGMRMLMPADRSVQLPPHQAMADGVYTVVLDPGFGALAARVRIDR